MSLRVASERVESGGGFIEENGLGTDRARVSQPCASTVRRNDRPDELKDLRGTAGRP